MKRANRDTKLHKHMAMYYCTRNMISQIMIKQLKKKLRKTLIKKKKKDKLDFLAKDSLIS
jgi:hypothetical protein